VAPAVTVDLESLSERWPLQLCDLSRSPGRSAGRTPARILVVHLLHRLADSAFKLRVAIPKWEILGEVDRAV